MNRYDIALGKPAPKIDPQAKLEVDIPTGTPVRSGSRRVVVAETTAQQMSAQQPARGLNQEVLNRRNIRLSMPRVQPLEEARRDLRETRSRETLASLREMDPIESPRQLNLNVREVSEEMEQEIRQIINPPLELHPEPIPSAEEMQRLQAQWLQQQRQMPETPDEHDGILENLWDAPPDVRSAFGQ
jgi:hypothetical protein